MDLRSLRYFIETASLSSFTQAAKKLHVTQSTISKMVRLLEEELNAPLLLRDGRTLTLTDTGRIVFERGEEMLAMQRQMMLEVRDLQALRRGTLTLGMPPMINVLFTPALKHFREHYPDIQLRLVEAPGPAIEQQVAANELDLGLTVLPAESSLGLSTIPVARHPVWAMAAKGVFRANARSITLRQLQDLPLVMLNEDFALTRALRSAFAAAGLTPQIAAHSAQWDWLVEMASAGIGVALLPEPFMHRLSDERLQALPIVEPEVQWEVAHVWSGRYLTVAAQAWLQACKSAGLC